jgi:hypothetical protein
MTLRLLPLLLVLALLTLLAAPRPAASQALRQEEPTSPVTPEAQRQIWLPLVRSAAYEVLPGLTIFGAQIEEFSSARGLTEARELGMTWMRRGVFRWRLVQAEENGPYDWSAFEGLERELEVASQHGVTPIIIMSGAPRWATTFPSDCAPIKPEYRDDFARFAVAMVARYSVPPYNVKFWEIGNEPDVDPGLAPIDSGFGCWGDVNDSEFYGGESYGELLRVAYPAIKAADPQAQVLFGGLLLNTPGSSSDRGSPERFFRGALEAMKDDPELSFDILSFHAYRFAFSSSAFDSLGGFLLGKSEFLRRELALYGRTPPPMINTETALLCVRPDEECRERQAAFTARIYIETHIDGLLGSLWYLIDNDHFYNSALINPITREPRPAYRTYRATVEMIGRAQYLGKLAGQARAVQGYRFSRGAQTLVVVWSDQNTTASVPIPAGTRVSCLTRDGLPFECPLIGGNVVPAVSVSPIYLLFEKVD